MGRQVANLRSEGVAELPGVSVVIPTYNRGRILEKALKALFDQTYPFDAYEIIVVDDGSTDGTEERIAALDPPVELRYVYKEHRGPAAARNVGIRMARRDIIIFIDSDIIVCREFIEAHVKARGGEDVITHGPVIHTNDIDNPRSASMKVTDISRAFFATGNVSISRQKLFEAGLFDEDFVEYGWEDLELGIRLKRLGLKPVYSPDAKGYHYKGRLELRMLPALLDRERQRGHTAILLYRKHPTFKVRMMIMLGPSFFAVDRLLTVGNWPQWPITRRFLEFLERKRAHLLLRFFVRIITNHAYFEGMREALRGQAEISH